MPPQTNMTEQGQEMHTRTTETTTPVPMEHEHEHTAPPTPPELASGKGRNRQRLLRGIQRISPSPSLSNLRRARSHSAPYRSNTRRNLSCLSLAATGPPTPLATRAGVPVSSPLGLQATSSSTYDGTTTEFPFFDYDETSFAVRKVDSGDPNPSQGTAVLPADVKISRTEVLSRTRTPSPVTWKKPFKLWDLMPHELQLRIFSFLEPKQLVQTSRVSKSFYRMCFDGQLWTSFDASGFYQDITADSLARIITSAGPFIKNLNLRGCVQVEHYKRAEVVVKACKNLMNATLEGCRNFQKTTLHTLLSNNERLVYLNLTGLSAVSNKSCKIVAESCPQLESFNVSWCGKVDSRGIQAVVDGCEKLTDLRASQVKGLDNLELAQILFDKNKLTRLVLSGCEDLNDEALKVMMHGKDPEIDILTDRAVVPPRKLNHLDLSRCHRLTDVGVRALACNVPELVGLQLSRCIELSDAALEPVLASTPRLTHLELENLESLTNSILSEHLAKAPCAPILEHLSLSHCGRLGDRGMLPVMKNCTALRSIDLDNTLAGDLVLAEAASMVWERSEKCRVAGAIPRETLNMTVYDCQHVTWTGIREVLFRNTQIRHVPGTPGWDTHSTEVIGLKVFYGFQMTVDEHHKRVLKGDHHAASRLERRWADYMQATEEAGMGGSGHRRRRRRARQAQALHADEEDGAVPGSRRRARTMGSCLVM